MTDSALVTRDELEKAVWRLSGWKVEQRDLDVILDLACRMASGQEMPPPPVFVPDCDEHGHIPCCGGTHAMGDEDGHPQEGREEKAPVVTWQGSAPGHNGAWLTLWMPVGAGQAQDAPPPDFKAHAATIVQDAQDRRTATTPASVAPKAQPPRKAASAKSKTTASRTKAGRVQVCTQCKKRKPAEMFSLDSGKTSGRRSSCKACISERDRARRDAAKRRNG